MTLIHRNGCVECPDAAKTTKNQLPMKKYIEAMVRKSFQLELVTEIGLFAFSKKKHLKSMKNYHQKKSKLYIYF